MSLVMKNGGTRMRVYHESLNDSLKTGSQNKGLWVNFINFMNFIDMIDVTRRDQMELRRTRRRKLWTQIIAKFNHWLKSSSMEPLSLASSFLKILNIISSLIRHPVKLSKSMVMSGSEYRATSSW